MPPHNGIVRSIAKPTEPMTTETPQLNEHKQNCDSASAEDKRACIMSSASKFAAGKQEYPPMHTADFDTSQTKAALKHTLSMRYSVVVSCAALFYYCIFCIILCLIHHTA